MARQGLGIVMTDAATPTVESLGMVVDGNALAVTNMGGMKFGSADVKVDGSTYTITGEATGADMKNPMAGMITKPFTVKVTLQLIGSPAERRACLARPPLPMIAP